MTTPVFFYFGRSLYRGECEQVLYFVDRPTLYTKGKGILLLFVFLKQTDLCKPVRYVATPIVVLVEEPKLCSNRDLLSRLRQENLFFRTPPPQE